MLVLLYSDSAPAIWSDFFCNIFIFLLTFFFILVISLFRNLLMFLSWTRVSRFSSKEFHSYTPCFIFCSLEQLLNWRRNLHEIIHIKRQGFLVGKTTVESIYRNVCMIPHAWRIFNRLDNTSECPMEKALKGCFELSATSDPLTRIPGHMPLSCMIRWTYPIYSVNLLLWICWSEFEEQQKSIVCAQSSNGGLAGLFYWLEDLTSAECYVMAVSLYMS